MKGDQGDRVVVAKDAPPVGVGPLIDLQGLSQPAQAPVIGGQADTDAQRPLVVLTVNALELGQQVQVQVECLAELGPVPQVGAMQAAAQQGYLVFVPVALGQQAERLPGQLAGLRGRPEPPPPPPPPPPPAKKPQGHGSRPFPATPSARPARTAPPRP